MTNFYHLPETDRLAEGFNPVLDETAKIESVEVVASIEAGAMVILGLLEQSLVDFKAGVVADFATVGLPAEVAEGQVDTILDSITGIFQPRVEAFNKAVFTAGENAMAAQARDLLTSLFEGLTEDATEDATEAPESEHDDCPLCVAEAAEEQAALAGVGFYL